MDGARRAGRRPGAALVGAQGARAAAPFGPTLTATSVPDGCGAVGPDLAAHNPAGLVHTAIRHRSPTELVASVVPFVHDAFRMGDSVYVSLSPSSTAALKAGLGRDADRIRWSDSTRWHPHPMRRLRAIRELVDGAERHGTGRMRLVGESPLPPVPAMVAEWERFDAQLNDVLAALPVTLVCTYDESTLPADVVERAPWSHPFLGIGPVGRSASYLEPNEYLARYRVPPVPVPADSPSLMGKVAPGEARALVHSALSRARRNVAPLPMDVVEDMALSVTELVTNSWQAGARSVAVTCWRVKGEAGAQVDDDGPGLMDPLAGYRWPDPAADRGRGLWLARQLVDLLDICATESGTSVRVRAFDASWTQRAA